MVTALYEIGLILFIITLLILIYFSVIDISPHNGTVIQAAELYNQNKDVQGLLAFLYNTKK